MFKCILPQNSRQQWRFQTQHTRFSVMLTFHYELGIGENSCNVFSIHYGIHQRLASFKPHPHSVLAQLSQADVNGGKRESWLMPPHQQEDQTQQKGNRVLHGVTRRRPRPLPMRSRYAYRFSKPLPPSAPVISWEHLMRPSRPYNYTPSTRPCPGPVGSSASRLLLAPGCVPG